jgi:hypothetical protein
MTCAPDLLDPPVHATYRAWSDRFLPGIKRIVGAQMRQTAPDDLDGTHATDLLMLDGRDVRGAARMRRRGHAGRVPYDFTLRSRSPGGGQTELAKWVNGAGDRLFYAHANARGDGFDLWWLIDLRAFGTALTRRASGYGLRHGTQFAWVDIRSVPTDPPLGVAAPRAVEAQSRALWRLGRRGPQLHSGKPPIGLHVMVSLSPYW